MDVRKDVRTTCVNIMITICRDGGVNLEVKEALLTLFSRLTCSHEMLPLIFATVHHLKKTCNLDYMVLVDLSYSIADCRMIRKKNQEKEWLWAKSGTPLLLSCRSNHCPLYSKRGIDINKRTVTTHCNNFLEGRIFGYHIRSCIYLFSFSAFYYAKL